MMMRMLALTAAVAVGTTACCAHEPALAHDRVWREVTASSAFGKGYSVSISMRQFKRSPKWRGKDDNPPLSARRAMEIAECEICKYVTVPERFEPKLKELVLREGPYGRWFWEVIYQFRWKEGGGASGIPHNFTVIVLMDGSVGEQEVFDLD